MKPGELPATSTRTSGITSCTPLGGVRAERGKHSTLNSPSSWCWGSRPLGMGAHTGHQTGRATGFPTSAPGHEAPAVRSSAPALPPGASTFPLDHGLCSVERCSLLSHSGCHKSAPLGFSRAFFSVLNPSLLVLPLNCSQIIDLVWPLNNGSDF